MTRPSALFIKLTVGKTFAEVLSEIRYKAKGENSGTEVSFIRKSKGGRALVELGPKTITAKRRLWFLVEMLLGNES